MVQFFDSQDRLEGHLYGLVWSMGTTPQCRLSSCEQSSDNAVQHVSSTLTMPLP